MLGKGENGQEIVSMSDRTKNRWMAPVRNVEAYWHALCDGNQVPLRSQVDPRGMESALENAFLMERIAPTMAKVRVAGSHLSDLMGMQIAGMPLSCLIAPADRERFGEAVGHLFGSGSIVKIELRAEGGFGKPDLVGHMILLPLRSDFGDMSRALGVLVSDGPIGRTPRRFTVSHVKVVPTAKSGIVDRRPVHVTEPAASLISGMADKPEPMQGLKESSTPFRGMLTNKRVVKTIKPTPRDEMDTPSQGNAHLRLVVSND